MKKYEIVDAHCHIYPQKIAAKAVAATDKFYGANSYGDGTVENLRTICQRSGIDHAIIQSVATTPKQVNSINEFIAAEVNAGDGFFTGLGTLHPDSEDLKNDIDHLIGLGLKGVKLHPDIQGFEMDGEKLFRMYELCEKEKLIMLIHTGDKRYDNSNPDRVEAVLKNFPKLKVIGAHLGGWSIWDEAPKRLSGFSNFFVDCSSSFGFADKKTIKNAISEYGADKVLFGTDYPMWGAEEEINNLLSLELSDEENCKILSGNAKKLFDI